MIIMIRVINVLGVILFVAIVTCVIKEFVLTIYQDVLRRSELYPKTNFSGCFGISFKKLLVPLKVRKKVKIGWGFMDIMLKIQKFSFRIICSTNYNLRIHRSMKLWMIIGCILMRISCQAKPISIDSMQDYATLDQFFKMTFLSEEYGYVLEGSKPISIRNFLSLDSFPISKDLKHNEIEFNKAILVREAIPLWNKFCSQQKNFVLKVVSLNDQGSSFLAPLEIAFINNSKLQQVIEENIDLFRYVLGSTNTVQDIVSSIIYVNQPLINILNHDLTLVGIVLGFGSHNSIIGGRQESICALSISKDNPPFAPQSCLMQDKGEHSLDFLSPERYGTYYLELAGGDDVNFRVDLPRLKPQSRFMNLVDEVRNIDKLEEPIPDFLWQEPKFVFGAFKGGSSNQPFFNQLHETQKKIRTLLGNSHFLELVLEKINKEPPVIRIKKAMFNSGPSKFFIIPQDAWLEILHSVANRFIDKEMKLAFIKAFNHPNDSYLKPPVMMGVSKAVFEGLKKAQSNLIKADLLFDKLLNDTSIKRLVPKQLYFKTILQGNEKRLGKENRVRIGYVIEDTEGNILFANHDSWLHLSETITGFALGLQGMHVQEKRILYIYPTLAYGALTTLPPCSALTITVQLLDIDSQSSATLPPLMPLDLSWVQDPSYYRVLEESLVQQPYFFGMFYREMWNKMKALNSSVCIDDSQKEGSEHIPSFICEELEESAKES